MNTKRIIRRKVRKITRQAEPVVAGRHKLKRKITTRLGVHPAGERGKFIRQNSNGGYFFPDRGGMAFVGFDDILDTRPPTPRGVSGYVKPPFQTNIDSVIAKRRSVARACKQVEPRKIARTCKKETERKRRSITRKTK